MTTSTTDQMTTLGWAERLRNKLMGERYTIISHVKEHESITADLHGQAAELGDETSNPESVLGR